MCHFFNRNFIVKYLITCYTSLQSQAKFDLERAQMALDWLEEMVGQKLDGPIKDSIEFGAILKDGSILCQ